MARLKGGDPLIFGRGGEEAECLRQAGIEVGFVPGITAAQGAACSAGLPLTQRGYATGVRYVTGHRAADQPLDLDWSSLADEQTTLVVYMGAANIGEIAMRLMTEGLTGSTPVMAIAHATNANEQRHFSTLDHIGPEMKRAPLPSPTLFFIGRVVSLAAESGFQAALPDMVQKAALAANA